MYAKWTPTPYTITFNVDGGAAVTAMDYTIESTKTIPSTIKTGKVFGGWTPNGVGNWGTSTIASGTSVTGKWGSVTLTAIWTNATYELTLDPTTATTAGTANTQLLKRQDTHLQDSIQLHQMAQK